MRTPARRHDAAHAARLQALIMERYDAQARVPAGQHGGGQFTSGGGGGGRSARAGGRPATTEDKRAKAMAEIQARVAKRTASLTARAAAPQQTRLFQKAPAGKGYDVNKTFQAAGGQGAVEGIRNKALVVKAAERGLAEHAMRQRTGQTARPPAPAPAAQPPAGKVHKAGSPEARAHSAALAAGASDDALKRAARGSLKDQKVYSDMHAKMGGTDAGVAALHEHSRDVHAAAVAELKKRGIKPPKGETDEPLTVKPKPEPLRIVPPEPNRVGFGPMAPPTPKPAPPSGPPKTAEHRRAELEVTERAKTLESVRGDRPDLVARAEAGLRRAEQRLRVEQSMQQTVAETRARKRAEIQNAYAASHNRKK